MQEETSVRLFSRRKLFTLGLGAGAIIVGSAGGWYMATRHEATPAARVVPAPVPTAGTTLFTYTGHKAPVFSASWSPDGTRIASASYDDTAQVWNAAGGERPIITYTGHTGLVGVIAWSPDGTRIASGGQDKTVQVWDATKDGRTLITYRGHSGVIEALVW